jgi:hypothetical protein
MITRTRTVQEHQGRKGVSALHSFAVRWINWLGLAFALELLPVQWFAKEFIKKGLADTFFFSTLDILSSDRSI